MFQRKTINCRGRIFDLGSPKIMGILNLSPDSFYDGGKWNQLNFLNRVEQMLNEGVDIIDIGAASSKPGADYISVEEELKRLIKPIQTILSKFPNTIISVDTWRAEVVKAVYNEGAHIINDISAGNLDPKLIETVAETAMPYILMHMKGAPKNMQINPLYDDVLTEISDFFIVKLEQLRAAGIKDIILDPGFGFGKTIEHNYKILANLNVFSFLELPLLAGISRKSMLYKPLGSLPEMALNATTAAHILCLEKGAKILRVHDVKEAAETIKIWNLYKNEGVDTTFISK
jgi:dihydropteroate synthase